jgi:hypothetical protein
MPGATLSRWTMAYFAAALCSLLGAEVLMATGYGYPSAAVAAPETLIVVHLVTIGWLTLIMLGALFQFVPVLIARPVYSNSLPLPTLVLLLAGLAGLTAGFMQLAGNIALPFSLLSAGALLLAAGFGVAIWNLGRTLWPARPLGLPARFVAVGLVCGAVTVLLGSVFSFVLAGQSANLHLSALTANGVPLHIVAGLGGWLTFTAFGVSYRLLSMFMLAPETERATSRAAFYAGAGALGLTVIGGIAAVCLSADLMIIFLIGAGLSLVALALYGTDIVHLYRARKRRLLELNSRLALVALANLAAAVVSALTLAGCGILEASLPALLFLIAFGWLSGLILAKLYKIVAFLTWLECCGPLLGKKPTPRVQDLVSEPRAKKCFALYFAAVWIAAVCLLLGYPIAFRFAALGILLATGAIAFELLRIRRLADVAAPLKIPELVRPHLLFALVRNH